MKVRFLIDGRQHNPDFNPPDPRRDPAGHAKYRRENSPLRKIPADTEVDDPDAWILCLPDATGTVKQTAKGVEINASSPDRIVLCEPIDDEAKTAVAEYLKGLPGDRRRADERLMGLAVRAAIGRRAAENVEEKAAVKQAEPAAEPATP